MNKPELEEAYKKSQEENEKLQNELNISNDKIEKQNAELSASKDLIETLEETIDNGGYKTDAEKVHNVKESYTKLVGVLDNTKMSSVVEKRLLNLKLNLDEI